MEATWTKNTKYFVILDAIQLVEVLDYQLIDIMKYDNTKEWQLHEVSRCVKHLEDSKIAIEIQISNSGHIPTYAVLGYIDSEDFDLAKYQFQVDEFLSIQEYKALIPIEI